MYRFKRILLASAMFSVCAYNAMADDCCADDGHNDLTGFLLSLGGVLDIDKYDADVEVAAKYENVDSFKSVKAKAADCGCDDYQKTVAFMKDFTKTKMDADGASNAITDGAEATIKADTAYANRSLKVKKNKTVAGGEVKGSAFYNVEMAWLSVSI